MQRLTLYLLIAAGLVAVVLVGYVALRDTDIPKVDTPDGPPAEPGERPGSHTPAPLPDGGPSSAKNGTMSRPAEVKPRPTPKKTPTLEDIEALIATGYRSEALDLLDLRIERLPKDARALELRGGLFLEDGAYRKAARDLRTSILVGGETYGKLMTFADASRRQDPRGATKALRRAIELDPRSARPHSLLALIHLRKGDTNAAKEEVRIALELDSREPIAVSLSERLLR